MARIDAHFEAFIAERQQSGMSQSSEQAYRNAWATFRSHRGSARLHVDPQVLHRLPYGPSRLVRHILTWCQASGRLPGALLGGPRAPRRVLCRPALEPEQVQPIIRGIKDPGVRILACLVFFTGLRAGTLLELKTSDVNLAARTLYVEETGQRVPLSDPAVEVIQTWHLWRRRHSKSFFHLGDGRPLILRQASAYLRQAASAHGLKAFGFGHLQYARVRLLSGALYPFNSDGIQQHLQHPFRLRYLNIPNLWPPSPGERFAPVFPVEHLLSPFGDPL